MSAGETDVATIGAARRIGATPTAKARVPSAPKLRDTWWRHVVAIIATIVALFPIVFVISASFNATNAISSEVIPAHVTLHNFGNLLHNNVCTPGQGCANAPYLRWYRQLDDRRRCDRVLHHSARRIRGVRVQPVPLQGPPHGDDDAAADPDVPAVWAIAAIYLLILNVGNIFHPIGINTLLGVVVVYLGGAMGVQAWLMKGFFDTIPAELDESARVDGATPAQIFWGVVLPLAAPVLVVVALISFVFTLNEFVIASALLQTTTHKTLPVGMQGFISDQYGQRWGPFAAGVADGDGSRRGAVPLPAALDRQRADRRLGQGMSLLESRVETLLDLPHHDGSELYLVHRPVELGDEAVVRLRVPRAHSADRVLCRYERDGEPRGVEAAVDEETDTDVWWRASFPVWNPVARYRLLLTGGDVGYAWVNALGLTPHEVTDADDFAVTTGSPGTALARRVRHLRDLPRPLRDVAPRRRDAAVGDSPPVGRRCRPDAGRRPGASSTAVTSAALSAPRPHRGARREPRLLDAVLPGRRRATATTRRRSTTSTRCSAATMRFARSATPHTRAASA